MQELRVQSLGREDPLEAEMATHSSILAWRIPGTVRKGTPLASLVAQGVSGRSSSCVWNPRVIADVRECGRRAWRLAGLSSALPFAVAPPSLASAITRGFHTQLDERPETP